MSTNPFLPEGQSDLPAQQFVIAAMAGNQVVIFEETQKLLDGISFVAVWESSSINREHVGNSLIQVSFKYSAENNTSVDVQGSSDGGATWVSADNAPIVITQTSGSKTAWAHAFFDEVTGLDLRFRIRFNTDVLVNIYSYTARVVDRGAMEFFQ